MRPKPAKKKSSKTRGLKKPSTSTLGPLQLINKNCGTLRPEATIPKVVCDIQGPAASAIIYYELLLSILMDVVRPRLLNLGNLTSPTHEKDLLSPNPKSLGPCFKANFGAWGCLNPLVSNTSLGAPQAAKGSSVKVSLPSPVAVLLGRRLESSHPHQHVQAAVEGV